MLDYLEQVFNKVCDDFGVSLLECNGEQDHIHLLVHYPPKVTLSKLVNSLKGVSSRMLRTKFKQDISNTYWKGVLWSPSYFAASCGGAPLQIIQEYIQNQRTPLS